jgi:hypothetical protein
MTSWRTVQRASMLVKLLRMGAAFSLVVSCFLLAGAVLSVSATSFIYGDIAMCLAAVGLGLQTLRRRMMNLASRERYALLVALAAIAVASTVFDLVWW